MKPQLVSLAARAFAQLNLTSRLTVLTFHRFDTTSGITREHIFHHLRFLAKHHEFVLPATIDSSAGTRCRAMVTVDDCHRDIYSELYPVARELNVPFVICVPTDFFLRRKWLWFDHLYWLLERWPHGVPADIGGRSFAIDSKHDVQDLKQVIKRQLPDQRAATLAALEDQGELVAPSEPPPEYESVGREEMREMLASGLVEICAHTISHTIATVLVKDEFDRELAECKRELESFAGREVGSFCYPNGEEGDFSDATMKAVRDAGFRMALTSVAGLNPVPFDSYLIRRIHAHKQTSSFEKEASGLGALSTMLRSRARA
jgi:peptidoglycan/xylan/chitin deacetylase (PgdA/CDA1 family)